MRRIIRSAGIPALIFLLCAPLAGRAAQADYQARVARVLKQTPLIDGHNDLPWEIRERFKGALAAIDLNSDTSKLPQPKEPAAAERVAATLRASRAPDETGIDIDLKR